MKRVFPYLLTTLLLTVFLLPACAAAKDFSEAERHAMANLTEVYGYTQEEADAFTFEVTETDTQWQVSFYPPEHPTWVYTSANDKQTGQFISGSTPFHVEGFSAYPGEGGVRDGLRTARANGWFTGMSAERRAAFLDWMEQWGVQPNDALYSGLMNGSLTTAQAVNEYFKSCYGEPETWPQPLLEWRDEELSSYGFTAEDTAPAAAQPTPQPQAPDTQGINRYETQTRTGKQPLTVTEFVGETPDELAQALSHPMLKGYACLCGAYQQGKITNDTAVYDTGLLALEKEGARLLVTLRRTAETETWTVMPVGEKALLSEGTLSITYDAKENLYTIACSRSDTETESFRVRVQYDTDNGILCRLQDCQSVNAATGESITIAAGDSRETAAADGEWYSVTTTAADGVTATEQIPALIPPYLDYTDADAFPTTAEACRADTGYALPDGYAVSCGAHLRAKTSSRSADLGTYRYGTLMEVLDTKPGDPYPWYRVRIGSVEGYMASLYVDYPGSPCAMKPLEKYPPLTVAKARKDISLKKGTGLFAGTVTKLPAGTKMNVLAECGGWLHVMVPQNGEPGWMMDLNGTDGYVKAADVVTAATSQQLDWLE